MAFRQEKPLGPDFGAREKARKLTPGKGPDMKHAHILLVERQPSEFPVQKPEQADLQRIGKPVHEGQKKMLLDRKFKCRHLDPSAQADSPRLVCGRSHIEP